MEKKAQELYPNNKTFCGGVAQVAREAFAKGARMQKEVDDKELSEKVSAAYQLGLSDKEKQMMAGAVEGIYNDGDWGVPCINLREPLELERLDKVRIIIIVKEEKDGTGRA